MNSISTTIPSHRRFVFSSKVCSVCGILIIMMLWLSQWQWHRHLQKVALIEKLDARLKQPVADLNQLAQQANSAEFWNLQIHSRVKASGTYDFEHEVLIRNRRFQNFPGVHLFTPLKLQGTEHTIIVNRGFVPLALATPDQVKLLARPISVEFVGLVKENVPAKFFAPRDPESGPGKDWVFAWLRPNIEAMSKQLPYPILPVYLEIIQAPDGSDISEQIVSSKSGRDDIFFLPSEDKTIYGRNDYPKLNYPVAVFDTVIPAGRHLGYVFEWAAMAVMTALIGTVLQLKRQR